MAQAQLYLFGAARLDKNGKPVDLDTRKALALLAYLALANADPGGGYTRDALAVFLYPESDQASARAALRRTLSPLRKALDEDCLVTGRERISLQPGCLWIDVLEFKERLKAIKNHPHLPAQVCSACMPLLLEAADLYQNGFMSGFSLRDSVEFDDWQYFQSTALRQDLAWVLEKLALGLAAQGDYEDALHQARRWLQLDSLQEEAHRQIMLLYAWSGQRNAALRQYRECVRSLDQALGVPPLEQTTQLYQAILENRVPEPPIILPPPNFTSTPPSRPPFQQESSPTFHGARGVEYPLVGRSIELQTLRQAYQAAAAGGYICVLEGEAGIGKTRLAEEFLAQARAAGAAVIRARCFEGEAALAYAPFLDGLSAALAQPKLVQRLKELPVSMLSPAMQLLPALSGLLHGNPPTPSPDLPGAQARFFEALRLLLSAMLEGSMPGILFIDDVQWADDASLDVLAYLAHRLPRGLLLLSWRSDAVPVDHRLRQLFVQAVRQAQAGNIALTRLQPNHLAEILRLIPDDFPLPEGFAGQLFQETEGNPFFVVEYLNSIQRNQGLTESGYWKMPRSIRDLLSARIQDAGEVNQQLLSAAAVLGRSFDFLMLREVSGRSEMEIVSGLEALMQRGLIIEDRTRDITPNPSYDFTHEKIRTLAYEQTSAARRILLHKRAADAFAARQRQRQSAALAAYHYQLAGQTNQAAEFFQLAGDYARAVYANREAIGHYQNALASGHSNPAALHESIGDLQSLSGEYLAALNSYEAAAARCEPESLGRIEHRLGVVHHLRGDWELAECHFQAALESPEITEATDLQARILADWSRTAYRRGEAQRALSLAERSLHLAEASQNQRALAQAQNILGILARQAGKTEAAIHHLQRSLEMATSLGEPGMQAAALNNLARAHAGCGELHTAIQLTQAALELCQQQGDRHRAAALHNNLADLYHAAGDTLSAQEQLKQAVVLFTEIGLQAGEPKPEIWMLTEW